MPPAFWRACEAEDVVLVGTNRVLAFTSLQGLQFDALVIRDTYRNLWHDQRVGARYHDELWKPHPAWKTGPSDRRVTHCDEFVRQVPEWQFERVEDRNGEAAVMKNSSVVIMAANMAWLWGARELYLVGVDYCGSHAKMIEPYASKSPGWEGQYDKPVPVGIEKQFARMAESVASAGGGVWNLSRGTKLRSVQQRRWDESWNCL